MSQRILAGRICLGLFLLAVVNFIAFNAVAMMIGGDALNGKIEGGHFFLSDHGRLTEVSRSVFADSRWHAASIFLTHPVGILAALLSWLFGIRAIEAGD
jgi:hypothetical protein